MLIESEHIFTNYPVHKMFQYMSTGVCDGKSTTVYEVMRLVTSNYGIPQEMVLVECQRTA